MIIDGKNAVVGQISINYSKIIRGKHKNTFTPHMDHGDFVVVKNILKILNSQEKNLKIKNIIDTLGTQEVLRKQLLKNYITKNQGEVLKLAVKRMLPGGPLAKKQLTKLKMYSGDKHPHEAQNLTVIELSKLNNKNLLRN